MLQPTDGSNDFEAVKLYPVAVRIFDNIAGRVLSSLLSVQQCEQASTGENIFHILNNELSRHNISWENCVSFSTDNASVMFTKVWLHLFTNKILMFI